MPKSQEGLARLVESEGVSPAVAEAFRRVDRADFVPRRSRREAYVDRPISLPEGQTTSQPSLIARMIDAMKPRPTDRVLEIGTGYGFQTALLAVLVAEVFSIERHGDLAATARANLAEAGTPSVAVVQGDGWEGLPDKAPFDGIVVSAAANRVPPALVEQLAEGGRLVIPVAGAFGDDVVLYQKTAGGAEKVRTITPARFVPLVHGTP